MNTRHASPTHSVAVSVQDASLRIGRHWIFRDVRFDAPPHGVVAVVGSSGSGKTSLLLALAGRMHLSEGTVDVGSLRVSGPKSSGSSLRAMRGRVAVARIADLVGLDPELTLHHNIRDAADWVGVKRSVAVEHFDAWRERLDLELDPQMRLSELPSIEATAAHLILGTLGNPDMIVLDDISDRLTVSERRRSWAIVREVAAPGPVVIASTLDTLTLDADVVVTLAREHLPKHAMEPEGSSEGVSEGVGRATEGEPRSEPEGEPEGEPKAEEPVELEADESAESELSEPAELPEPAELAERIEPEPRHKHVRPAPEVIPQSKHADSEQELS